jgi:hypothetical protein
MKKTHSADILSAIFIETNHIDTKKLKKVAIAVDDKGMFVVFDVENFVKLLLYAYVFFRRV